MPNLVDRAQPGRRVLQRLSPAEKVNSGHRRRHHPAQGSHRGFPDLLCCKLYLAPAPWVYHVGLERRALHEDAVVQHGLVEVRLDLDVDADGRLEVVVAVKADVRLDDRYEALVLADEGVPVVSFCLARGRVGKKSSSFGRRCWVSGSPAVRENRTGRNALRFRPYEYHTRTSLVRRLNGLQWDGTT